MFELKNIVNCEGKLYSWSQVTNSIVEIELHSVSAKDCPEAVVETLLKSAYAEKKTEK